MSCFYPVNLFFKGPSWPYTHGGTGGVSSSATLTHPFSAAFDDPVPVLFFPASASTQVGPDVLSQLLFRASDLVTCGNSLTMLSTTHFWTLVCKFETVYCFHFVGFGNWESLFGRSFSSNSLDARLPAAV